MKPTALLTILFFMVFWTSEKTYAERTDYSEARVYGYGHSSCGSFVKAIEEDKFGLNSSLNYYMAWTSGYVSANSIVDNFDYFKNTDTEGVKLSLESYCRENPLDTYYAANIKLLTKLAGR